MYELVLEPGAYRLFKKLPPDVRVAIVTKAERLKISPLLGEPLQGRYSAYRSLHFHHNGVAYRIIYQVILKQKMVAIQLADKRENIYKRLQEMKL